MKLCNMYLLIINMYLPFSAPEDVKPDIIDAAKQGIRLVWNITSISYHYSFTFYMLILTLMLMLLMRLLLILTMHFQAKWCRDHGNLNMLIKATFKPMQMSDNYIYYNKIKYI